MPAQKPKTATAKKQNGRKRAASHTPPEGSQLPRPERVKIDGSEENDVGGSTDVLANATRDDLIKYVEMLKKRNIALHEGMLVSYQNSVYPRDYEHWSTVGVSFWEQDMRGFMATIFNWSYDYGIRVTDGRPNKILSKEQKKQLILSMDGWVVQEDFDSIVSRLPDSPRRVLLQYFLQILILKDVWHRFWQNPFWYLEPTLAPDSADPAARTEPGFDTVTPFGEDVSRLYSEFQRADLQLAHHWRAQTVRLANTVINYNRRNGAFGAKHLAIRKAKATEFAQAMYADPTFQCLLRDPSPEFNVAENVLIQLYQHFAELAVKISAAQPAMEWLFLKDAPTTFERTSHQITAVSSHHLYDRERRLNGRRVLAIVNPILKRTGTLWNDGRDGIIVKGEVLVEDPKGRSAPHFWFPGEAREKRKKAREEKKARDEKKVREEEETAKVEGTGGVDEQDSSPEGKARKGGQDKT
ncbi:hypothetical protein BDW42DRAFT_197292 [Aspergillus taichungensis]|uniref:Uncharacterized protein n=1 Tax=Aspergillus taichungensis TaxID=482145 RepID=A0A2J5HH80_9EURO|nr:hypothetical protein BDW42DRAFT_197292 [Aspergillus taichungensis]